MFGGQPSEDDPHEEVCHAARISFELIVAHVSRELERNLVVERLVEAAAETTF